MNKLCSSLEEAVHDIHDGASVLAGGFGLCGIPENLIQAVYEKGPLQLTVISNGCGTPEQGLGIWLKKKMIRKVICSFIGENPELERLYLKGEVEIEFTPQGTLAEKIRAGGAGIPAFYTPTGVGTQIEAGGLPIRYGPDNTVEKFSPPRESRYFGERKYLLETAIRADFALIKASKADTFGNLVFEKTTRNFQPMMCAAARVTIVEAETIVPVGELQPEHIHVPGVYVQRLIKGNSYQKAIEHRTTRSRNAA